jgi:hypothetical protein
MRGIGEKFFAWHGGLHRVVAQPPLRFGAAGSGHAGCVHLVQRAEVIDDRRELPAELLGLGLSDAEAYKHGNVPYQRHIDAD